MKIYLVDNHEFFSVKIEEGQMISFCGYLPINNVVSGNYELLLVSDDFILKLANVNISNLENIWHNLGFNWKRVGKKLFGSVIILTTDDYDRDNVLKMFSNKMTLIPSPSKIKFKIVIKDPLESDQGYIHDNILSEPTVSDCIRTTAPNRILGADCPMDPETGLEFKECLNWRRTDDVGKSCRMLFSDKKYKSTIENSITNFCSTNIFAGDCKCINRAWYNAYKKNKNFRSESDYCWYKPCSSGSYLVQDIDNKSLNCNGVYCQIFYKNTAQKNILFNENQNIQHCNSVSPQIDTKDNNLIVVCMAIFIIFIILIVF